MEIPTKIKKLMQTLLDNNFEAFVVGGWCRDTLLGLNPKDVDIFTNATGEQILELFPKGKVLGNDERQERILTVIVGDTEISQYRSNGKRTEVGTNLEYHLKTCDFTINSQFCGIDGIILNKTNDLDITAVGYPLDRILEDPLRILRALRFSATLNRDIDFCLEDACIENISLLDTISKERIQTEFIKMLSGKYFKVGKLFKTFLRYIYPKFKELHQLDCGKYHDETPFEHMISSLEIAHTLTGDYRIMIACFLHDIGKLEAFEMINGNATFYQHQKIGAEIVKELLTELKFSNEDIKFITTMIKHHMMDYITRSNKTTIKMFNDLEDNGIAIEDMLIMLYADNQANTTKPRIKFNEFYKGNNWLRDVYKLKYQRMPFRITDLEISGKDVLNLGLNGKEIGITLNKIFNEVVEAQLKNDRHTLLYRLKEITVK